MTPLWTQSRLPATQPRSVLHSASLGSATKSYQFASLRFFVVSLHLVRHVLDLHGVHRGNHGSLDHGRRNRIDSDSCANLQSSHIIIPCHFLGHTCLSVFFAGCLHHANHSGLARTIRTHAWYIVDKSQCVRVFAPTTTRSHPTGVSLFARNRCNHENASVVLRHHVLQRMLGHEKGALSVHREHLQSRAALIRLRHILVPPTLPCRTRLRPAPPS